MSGSGRRATSVGFSQHRFGCEGHGCGGGEAYLATGFDVGFRLDLRTTGSIIPWFRLGGITTQVEAPMSVVGTSDPSSTGLGGEVGLGVYIGATSAVALVPSVRYAAVNTELPDGRRLRMRYVVADVALALAF
jgi:hypothetical protein